MNPIPRTNTTKRQAATRPVSLRATSQGAWRLVYVLGGFGRMHAALSCQLVSNDPSLNQEGDP
jgi:hypothetical protein